MRVPEAGCGVEVLEPETGARALLDSPMILFQYIRGGSVFLPDLTLGCNTTGLSSGVGGQAASE